LLQRPYDITQKSRKKIISFHLPTVVKNRKNLSVTQSMTGFASKIVEIPLSKHDKLSLALHLKTLNARYFEITCRLPSVLNHVELGIHRILKTKLERGHVYLAVKVQHAATQHVVLPSQTMIQEYLQAIETIKKTCKIQESVSLQTLLTLPHIFQIEEEYLDESTQQKFLDVIEQLADLVIQGRKHEGAILAKDICMHMQSLIKHLQKVDKLSAKICKEKKAALHEVVSKIEPVTEQSRSLEQCMLDNQKSVLISELEKMDIHEEVVRAQLHAKSMLALIKGPDASKGKKLDFILQELNREINTIASKCSHSTISALTIDMKTDIEKAREQAQNIL
jgi:uncharacterized protein (TIGR00255 family)